MNTPDIYPEVNRCYFMKRHGITKVRRPKKWSLNCPLIVFLEKNTSEYQELCQDLFSPDIFETTILFSRAPFSIKIPVTPCAAPGYEATEHKNL